MKLLAIQSNTRWLDPGANMRHIESLIDAHLAKRREDDSGTDLIVLPEMFTTGFVTDPFLAPCIDLQHTEQTIEWMRKTASGYGCAVAGSIAVSDGDSYYNRLYLVDAEGVVDQYDKRHLFTFAGEDRSYCEGTRRVVVNWRGVRILLLTCYDLRFPVFARNRSDYDLMICCANWPEQRIAVWDTLLRARAIENACYVVGVNRVGSDPSSSYCGHSAVIDFKGNHISSPQDHETLIEAAIDINALAEFRLKFPVLDDADDFRIDL